MFFFIIKNIFALNSREKLVITGKIKSENEKWHIDQSNCLLINNDIKLPIQEINDAIIKGSSYTAFTFDLDILDNDLLQDILKLEEGQELKII